jgi:hypothetical protein
MPATHGGQPGRLKIPFADFKERIDAILIERENLGALTAGQPAQVRPQMHSFVLNWFRRIEAALRDNLEPASYAQSLQTNRYMAILEDRLPYGGVGHRYSDRACRSARSRPASGRSPRIVFEGGARPSSDGDVVARSSS